MSNNGLIGLPSGRNLMDAASTAVWCGLAVGIDTHYVGLPVSPDSIQDGLTFTYVPTQTNVNGPVGVLLNGIGPIPLLKLFRTSSGESLAPSGMPLIPGDIQPFRPIECKVTLSNSDPGYMQILVTSGIGVDDSNVGLGLRTSASQAAARTVLGLASGATTTVGTAATRNVGTSMGGLVEVVDGSGDVNAALNIANRQLTNLLTVGVPRVIWASVIFSGTTGIPIASFNGGASARSGAGTYNVSFPDMGTTSYFVGICADVVPSSSGFNCAVIAGTRATAGVSIQFRQGNTSVDPVDPAVLSVIITKIS